MYTLAAPSASSERAPRAARMSTPEGDVNALENRLATHAVYDDGNKRLLEQLLTGNEELRKNNASLELENQRLQHTLDLDLRRHKEVAKTEHFSDMYDWIVNIELLSDVSKEVSPLPILHPPRLQPPPHIFPSPPALPRPAPRSPCARARLARPAPPRSAWPAAAHRDGASSSPRRSCKASTRPSGSTCCRARHGPRVTARASRRPSAGAAPSLRCWASMTRARRSSSTT